MPCQRGRSFPVCAVILLAKVPSQQWNPSVCDLIVQLVVKTARQKTVCCPGGSVAQRLWGKWVGNRFDVGAAHRSWKQLVLDATWTKKRVAKGW
jgi:hypothetical protein